MTSIYVNANLEYLPKIIQLSKCVNKKTIICFFSLSEIVTILEPTMMVTHILMHHA